MFNTFSLDRWIFGVIAILIAITVHEFSHAWMATRLGDGTAKYLGRLSLNPLAHWDLIGTTMLFVFMTMRMLGLNTLVIGWAKPVPYNPAHVRNGRFGETLIAIAGPLSNVIVAFLAALPGRIYLIQHQALPSGQLYIFLAIIVTLNVFLAAFNLIPIPPLDGSKILYLILGSFNVRQESLLWLEQSGPILLLLLIFADSILNINVISWLLQPIIYVINFIVGSSIAPF